MHGKNLGAKPIYNLLQIYIQIIQIHIKIYQNIYEHMYKYEIKFLPIFRCRINPWLVRSSQICRKLADSSPLSFQLLGLCQNTKLLRGPNVQSWDPSDICDQYLSKPLLQELPLLWPSLCRLCLLHQCHHTLCLVDCIFDMVLDRYIKS